MDFFSRTDIAELVWFNELLFLSCSMSQTVNEKVCQCILTPDCNGLTEPAQICY